MSYAVPMHPRNQFELKGISGKKSIDFTELNHFKHKINSMPPPVKWDPQHKNCYGKFYICA